MIPAVFLQVAAQNVFKCSTRWVFRVCDWSSKRLISLLLLIVTAFLNRRRPNSFVMITANRVLHCNADTPEEMHHWITLLQRSKGDTRVDGQEFIIRGDDAITLTAGVHPSVHLGRQIDQIYSSRATTHRCEQCQRNMCKFVVEAGDVSA